MEVINTLGRRKSSVARLYMVPGNGNVTINKRELNDYFPRPYQQIKLQKPFQLTENTDKFDLNINVKGGGITGQVEAIRLAIARALVKVDAENKSSLKAEKLMTRDPRMVERKKFGQKKARKKFQFSKR